MQRADCGRPSTFPEFRIPYHHHFAELPNIIFGEKRILKKYYSFQLQQNMAANCGIRTHNLTLDSHTKGAL